MPINWKLKCRELKDKLDIYEQLASVSASVADMALFQRQMLEDSTSDLQEWVNEVTKAIEILPCKECEGAGRVSINDSEKQCGVCAGYGVRVFIANPNKLIELMSD